jgi:HPt (histidine-containing phosphotransfer) domain-containing protein
LIDTSLVNLGTDISGVSSNLTTGLANADKSAQTYANNAKTGAESTAKGYADAAESSAKKAAQEYANTAESKAKTDAQNYAKTLVGQMDGSVAQYLGAGGGTLTGKNYVISPYISGGYLNITSTSSRVIIDPHNKTETGWIF